MNSKKLQNFDKKKSTSASGSASALLDPSSFSRAAARPRDKACKAPGCCRRLGRGPKSLFCLWQRASSAPPWRSWESRGALARPSWRQRLLLPVILLLRTLPLSPPQQQRSFRRSCCPRRAQRQPSARLSSAVECPWPFSALPRGEELLLPERGLGLAGGGLRKGFRRRRAEEEEESKKKQVSVFHFLARHRFALSSLSLTLALFRTMEAPDEPPPLPWASAPSPVPKAAAASELLRVGAKIEVRDSEIKKNRIRFSSFSKQASTFRPPTSFLSPPLTSLSFSLLDRYSGSSSTTATT